MLATLALLAGGSGLAQAAPGGPQPVPSVDLARYLGTWHQVAAVPAPFSLICARDTRANYSLGKDGDVVVRNTCTTWAGTPNQITGTARVVDKKTSAQLRVRFPSVPNQGGPDGPPNYVIVGLASDYSWAVVTDPSRLSGFVLSRTPALSADKWRAARTAIAAAGQSDCLYLTSPTTGGLEEIVPLCTKSR
ncbi:MAG: lipocalin family protein [Gordonia sp. (in: high G+C Gram-positive bacteria)]|uniref:lipocalin family protein n=1 Tax=Gordonia sp. (in: high G+C Gram-positive bacteria) TaxID=84139 RepID=UPI003BB65DF7